MTLALLSAFVWALFPVVTTLSFSSVSPLWSAGIATLFSTVFFGVVLVARGQWKRSVSALCQRRIVVACLFIGVGYYMTQYIGISLTTPGNAAIVSLMEIFFSYLFISVIGRHEKLILSHVLGALCMAGGSLFILLPSVTGGVHLGDIIIFFGSMLPPIGNFAMQQARKEVSAAFIMFWRSLVGSFVLMTLAGVSGGLPTASGFFDVLPLLLFIGFIILGLSKILWIEAIHRLPITQTISIAAIQPLLTMLYALVILGTHPSVSQFYSLPPMILGMFLLTRKRGVRAEALEEV